MINLFIFTNILFYFKGDKIATTLRREKRQPTTDEADVIARADALRDALIQVDVFEHETAEEATERYVRPALRVTEMRLQNVEKKTFEDYMAGTNEARTA